MDGWHPCKGKPGLAIPHCLLWVLTAFLYYPFICILWSVKVPLAPIKKKVDGKYEKYETYSFYKNIGIWMYRNIEIWKLTFEKFPKKCVWGDIAKTVSTRGRMQLLLFFINILFRKFKNTCFGKLNLEQKISPPSINQLKNIFIVVFHDLGDLGSLQPPKERC